MTELICFSCSAKDFKSAGDTTDAIRTYQQAVELARESQDHARFGLAVVSLADTAFQSGDLTGTYLQLLEEAKSTLEGHDDCLHVRDSSLSST